MIHVNWFVVISVSLILVAFGWTWLCRRALFIFPSTWVLLLLTLVYLAPALWFSAEIAEMSPYAVTALAYCATFVAGGLFVQLTLRSSRFLPMPALPEPSAGAHHASGALRMVLAVLAVIMAWYLALVPLRATGLYGLLLDPDNYALLREESLKLVGSASLQYVYLIGFSALSPLAFTLMLARSAELRGIRKAVLVAGVTTMLAFYLLITGARIGLVNLALAGLMYAFLRNHMQLGLRPILLAGVIFLGVPVLLTILREQGRGDSTVLEYVAAVGDRIFLVPLLISGWFVEYADTFGRSGLTAAMGFGDQPNWTNLIALEFLDRYESVTIESVTTPAAFIFSNYLYFGWLGLIPSWVALFVIDMPMRFARRALPPLRVPLIATMLYFSVIFAQSGFGVTVLSHGYFLLALIAWVGARRATRYGNSATPP